jgi:tetratricopeptide (TPR) repeat protein
MNLEEAQEARRDKKYKRAIQLYDQIINENPHSAQAYAGLSLTYAYINENEYAFSMANKALQIDANQPLAHIALAAIHHAKGELENFRMEVEKAFKLDPFFYEVACTYAQMLINEQKLDDALPIFEKIIEANPKKVCPHYLLGYINFQKKQYNDALIEFKKAFTVKPSLELIRPILATLITMSMPWSNIIFALLLIFWFLSAIYYKIATATLGIFILLSMLIGGNQKRLEDKKGWAILYLICFFVFAYIFYNIFRFVAK